MDTGMYLNKCFIIFKYKIGAYELLYVQVRNII